MQIKIQKEQRSTGVVYRAETSENLHFAHYSAAGERILTGSGYSVTPTDEEIAAWDEAIAISISEIEAEESKYGRRLYIRFGNIPRAGYSVNHRDNVSEAGVSVYAAWEMADGSYTIDMDGVDAAFLLFNPGRAAYEMAGELVGVGADGEPLLESATKVKKISATVSMLFADGEIVRVA